MSIYGKGAQIRRGLSRGLDFYTQQQLASRATEGKAVQNALAQRERDTDAEAERRVKTALELAKIGNYAAQGGLQGYVRGDENALASIGEFDQAGAQERDMATKLLEPFLRQEQYGAANELAGRVGLPQSFAPTARERAGVDLLGAQKLAAETKSKIDESVGAARVAHINALAGAARKRTDQIAKEIQQKASGGKLDLDNIKEMRQLLETSSNILGKQLEQISEAPDFFSDEERTQINPKYQQALKELSATNSYNRKLLDTIVKFQAENALPPVPARNAPPYNPGAQPQQNFDYRGMIQGMLKNTQPQITTPDGKRWTLDQNGNYVQVQ